MKCPSFLVTVDITREFVVKHCGSYYRFFLRKKTWAAVLPVIRKEGNSDPNKLQMQDLIRIKEPAKQNHRPITACKENGGGGRNPPSQEAKDMGSRDGKTDILTNVKFPKIDIQSE